MFTPDLASRKAFKRQWYFRSTHSGAVVSHLDKPTSTLLHLYPNRVSPSIKSIFDQLFDHTGRSLDHLTSRDPLLQLRRKNMNTHVYLIAYAFGGEPTPPGK